MKRSNILRKMLFINFVVIGSSMPMLNVLAQEKCNAHLTECQNLCEDRKLFFNSVSGNIKACIGHFLRGGDYYDWPTILEVEGKRLTKYNDHNPAKHCWGRCDGVVAVGAGIFLQKESMSPHCGTSRECRLQTCGYDINGEMGKICDPPPSAFR